MMDIDKIYTEMDDRFDDAILNGITKAKESDLKKEFTQSSSATSGLTAYGNTGKKRITLKSRRKS